MHSRGKSQFRIELCCIYCVCLCIWILCFLLHFPDEAAGSSEEEFSYGEAEVSENQEASSCHGDQELKQMLLRKYSGYLSSLRKEFLKKKKKGKLPRDARLTLLDWWNTHYRWPYPTVLLEYSFHQFFFFFFNGIVLSVLLVGFHYLAHWVCKRWLCNNYKLNQGGTWLRMARIWNSGPICSYLYLMASFHVSNHHYNHS